MKWTSLVFVVFIKRISTCNGQQLAIEPPHLHTKYRQMHHEPLTTHHAPHAAHRHGQRQLGSLWLLRVHFTWPDRGSLCYRRADTVSRAAPSATIYAAQWNATDFLCIKKKITSHWDLYFAIEIIIPFGFSTKYSHNFYLAQCFISTCPNWLTYAYTLMCT